MSFTDKDRIPGEKELSESLGEVLTIWNGIIDHVKGTYSPVREEWKFYGKKYGWQLKVFLKKRNLFFLIPKEGGFQIVFIFGDRAVEVIKASPIDQVLIDMVSGAKKYAEGRGLPIEITDLSVNMDDIKELIRIKIKN